MMDRVTADDSEEGSVIQKATNDPNEVTMCFRTKIRISTLTAGVMVLFFVTAGCGVPADVITNLEDALNTYVQNRSVTEQVVRDLKSKVEKNQLVLLNPDFQRAIESYYEARDSYNHFLDEEELATKNRRLNPDVAEASQNARSKATQFLEDATRALRPSINARGIDYESALAIPNGLPKDLWALPPKSRDRAIKEFDQRARWKSWSEL